MNNAFVDVCICTHNPRAEIFAIALKSLIEQTADKSRFKVLVVDNASSPSLDESILTPLREAGIAARMVVEEIPGLSRARLKAIDETESDWVLFIDDDNELTPDFLENGLKIMGSIPDLGCFGGKLLLPDYIKPTRIFRPFLPYLAIKDHGDEVMTDKTNYWGPWEPPGAGSFVHRRVLERYKARSQQDELFFTLGRTGKKSVASCEDSLMMRGAVQLDLFCSYQPALKIIHHINQKRFSIPYLLRLMYGFGVSIATCELMLNNDMETPDEYKSLNALYILCKRTWKSHKLDCLYAVGVMIMYYGQYKTYRDR